MDGKVNQIARCIDVMKEKFDESSKQLEEAHDDYIDALDSGGSKHDDRIENLIELNAEDYKNLADARRMLVKWMKEIES